jgi:hypothetical protein
MYRIISIILVFSISAFGATTVTKRPAHPYRAEYKRRTFGKGAIAPTLGGAAIREAGNSPHQWGRGAGGFGKRVGSSFGTNMIKHSIEFPIAAARHEDLHYHRSDKKGFGPRLKHALVSTVVTRKTTSGKKTVASGRISGAVGSGVVASAWQPAGFSVAGGAATGGIILGGTAASNVAREFWPRHHRHQARRRAPRP